MKVEQRASKAIGTSRLSTQPENARKYDSKSKEAANLNEAVAQFICKDQVPIYTVEKQASSHC